MDKKEIVYADKSIWSYSAYSKGNKSSMTMFVGSWQVAICYNYKWFGFLSGVVETDVFWIATLPWDDFFDRLDTSVWVHMEYKFKKKEIQEMKELYLQIQNSIKDSRIYKDTRENGK
jgi:hypothetical protein